MKKNKCIYLCVGLLLCSTVAPVTSRGASKEDIQKNFNRLVKTKQCPGCDLHGTVLTRMDLRGADLQGADLTGAKLSLSNLSKANLQNAILRKAILGGADFSGADLRGADLTGAKLAGAYLKEAILDQEIMQDKPYEPEELPESSPAQETGESDEEKADIEDVELSEPSAQAPAQEVLPSAEPADAVSIPSASEDLVSADEMVAEPSLVAANEAPNEAVTESVPETLPEAEIVQEPELPEQPVAVAPASGEKKTPEVALPDLGGKTETTLRSKELVPLADVSEADAEGEEVLENTAQVERKAPELDEIPVIDTASEQAEGSGEEKEAESSLWDSLTSLFHSDAEQEKKTAEKQAPFGDEKQERIAGIIAKKEKEAEKDAQSAAHELQKAESDKTEAIKSEAAAMPAESLSQPLSQSEKQQVGAYSVETFAQSKARLQGLAEKLLDKKRCVSCDLAGIDLKGKDLEEADLERADLSGAQLENADLHSANLKGVNFTDANLKNADLRQADLYLADFTNADLTGAQLEGALTDSTDFTGAIGAKLDVAQ
ncbi:MAG: pentapeptide repeat-containing protein [Candidatus Electrothrix scaldis]|nr:MAG: pentapeptide repeat-containing protein [Candidatus Electrothrix sp. GW3-3]